MGLFDFAASALGSVLGFAGENRNTDAVNEANAAQLERQIEANKETMQNRHQWEVSDLKAAGINPMLSATSPTGTLSAPSANPMQKSNSAVHLAQLGQLYMEGKKLDIERMNAKANLTNAESAKENAITNRQQMLHNARQIDADIALKNNQINVMVRTLDSIIDNTKSQTRLNIASAVKNELENDWIPRIRKAQLNQVETDIANSIILTAGKITLMDRQGRASLTNAAAAYMMAKTAEENGVSLRELNKAKVAEVAQKMGFEKDLFPSLKEKAEAEAETAQHEEDIAESRAIYANDDAKIFTDFSLWGSSYRTAHRLGKVISELTGIAVFGNLLK